MLLVIHNLPLEIRLRDIKSLVRSRCGINEIIMDKMVKESNISQAITVGVANDEEVDALMRNINGYYLGGQQLYVEDMRKKSKPAIAPQRPGRYDNDEPQYRPPAPVKKPYGMDRQRSNQPAIPSLLSEPLFMSNPSISGSQLALRPQRPDRYDDDEPQYTPPASVNKPYGMDRQRTNQPAIPSLLSEPLFMSNTSITPGSQNPYMDYGNQEQSPQNLQFGSQGGHNMVWNEGDSRYGHSSLMNQEVKPGPSRYGDDRREPARDRGYDRFPQEDRKRRRSPDRGDMYERRDYSEKYDPEDAFRDDYATDNLGGHRGFANFQTGGIESLRGAVHSNSDVRYPNNERLPYGSHASGVQSKPDDDRYMNRDDERRNPQRSSVWNEPPQRSFNTDGNPRNSDSRWNETPQQAFKTDRNPRESSNRPPQQSFKTERNPQNSNSRWNEPPGQSYKTDSEVPPTKRYKFDDVKTNESKFAPSHETDAKSVYKAVTWRNEAVTTIAKKILRGRIHYKMNNNKYQTGLSAIKHLIKIQVEEVIKFAYPHENLAIVPPDEIIDLYRRKFTHKDDDELFAKTFVVSDKANTLGLARKIIKGPTTTLNRHQAEILDKAQKISPLPLKPLKGKKQKNKPPFKSNKPDTRQSFTPNASDIRQGFTPNNPNISGIRQGFTSSKTNNSTIRPSFTPNKPNASNIRPRITPNKANAPGIRPSFTPNKPNAPGIRPSFTPNKPNAPGIRPSFTPNKPNPPGIRPSVTPNKSNAPGIRPNKPNAPGIRPNKPNAPGIRPSITPNKPNAPGIRPNITPNKPNAPNTKSTSTPNMPKPIMQKSSFQNQTSKQNNPKQGGGGSNVTPSAQTNVPRPGKLPQYINGNKKQSIQQKQMAKREFLDDDVYKCSPDLEKAVALEVDEICNQFVLGCETTDEEQKEVAQFIRDKSLPEFKKTIRLHVVKRLLNIKTNLVARIFAHGKPPSRVDVEQVLKPFGVYILKKSISSKLMYVATCDSYENYDKLCATDGITLNTKGEVTTLIAKPFHLTMPFKFRRQRNKYKKTSENLLSDETAVCDENDDGDDDDDGNGHDGDNDDVNNDDGTIDDDVQVIEPQQEKIDIDDSIVLDESNDEVTEKSDKVVENVENVDTKIDTNDAEESKVDVEISNEGKSKDEKQDENKVKEALPTDGGAGDNVDDVDIDIDALDEDDLEDY